MWPHELQRECLRGLGAWLEVNGEAIRGTSPWSRAESMTACGVPVRFTRNAANTPVTILVAGNVNIGTRVQVVVTGDNGISGSTYQIIEMVKKSSGFLGIGGGTKTSYTTTTGALDPEMTQPSDALDRDQVAGPRAGIPAHSSGAASSAGSSSGIEATASAGAIMYTA